MENKKLVALALMEGISHDSGNTYSSGRAEYLILTEYEREEAVKDYIKETVWAFNASFLSGETGLPEEVFTALSEKCESANDPILSLIEKTCGFVSFVESAVDADGYGHFLSPYDGEEQEEEVDGVTYYIYRVN